MQRQKVYPRLILALSLIMIWSTACSSATPQATIPAPTQALPTAAQAVPTAASVTEPAAEPSPTAPLEQPTLTPVVEMIPSPTPETAQATPTAAPQALSAESVQGWCLPEDATLAMTSDPLNPPASARIGETVGDGLEIRNLPAYACVFTYTLNNSAPDSLQLQVYEIRSGKPWLTAALTPVEGSPNTVSAVLRHTYIIAPPLWDVSYNFALVDTASSIELRRDAVNLHRWTPTLCWNGRKPNPITLRCPLAQDLHPWDAGYGTPMPTANPENDD